MAADASTKQSTRLDQSQICSLMVANDPISHEKVSLTMEQLSTLAKDTDIKVDELKSLVQDNAQVRRLLGIDRVLEEGSG